MKLHNLTIENFRSFDRFTLNNLGRVNLLVGTNNSGKTSVLEAAYVLLSSNKLWAIWDLLSRRGETYPEEGRSGLLAAIDSVIGVRHLFRGHWSVVGARFKLQADSDEGIFETRVSIRSTDPQARHGTQGFLEFEDGITTSMTPMPGPPVSTLRLRLRSLHPLVHPNKPMRIDVPLDRKDGVTASRMRKRLNFGAAGAIKDRVQIVAAAALTSQAVTSLYDEIALTKEEDLVLEALKILEPKIERIATMAVGATWSGVAARGGIVIRMADREDRIPIGSMGEGIWRMLGLALTIVNSRDGILLIDEIDTGLHYSIMGKMWRFLNDCSQRFNVQIIATTHSRDCYQSLGEICREDVLDSSDVTIQRIDRRRAEAVAYSEAEIIAAADRDIEVR